MRFAFRFEVLLFVCACVSNPRAFAQTLGGCAMFPANNVWNTRVDTLPVDASSATYISTVGSATHFHADFGTDLSSGIPFNLVNGSQAKVPVVFDVPTESDPGPYPIPPSAVVEGGSDQHVLVLDTTNCVLYEMESGVKQIDGSWTAYAGAVFNMSSNALRPVFWTSADAAGLPILPGLVRYDEILAGAINHALRFTVPQTRNTFIWPARHKASVLTGSQYPPMGQRFRLKASFDISKASAAGQIILTAMKKYGIILADNGGAWFVSGTSDARWDDNALFYDFASIHGSDFEAVDESGLIADPNSGQVKSATKSPPTADSESFVSQHDGSETITLHYSSSSGAGALSDVYALFSAVLQPSKVCFVLYDQPTNSLYLSNDAGNGTVAGSLAPGAAGTLQNSLCALHGAASSVVSSGNSIALALNLTFSGVFASGQIIYGYAADNAGMNSGWQKLGQTATPSSTPPTVVSGGPNADKSPGYTLAFSSVNGSAYLNATYALVNTSLSVVGGCAVLYYAPANVFYLFNDAGTALVPGSVAPGGAGTLSNTQCSLIGSGSSVSGSGNTLTMELHLTLSAPFSNSLLTLYGYAADTGGMNSGWQNLSIPSNPLPTPPTADSVTGMAPSTLSQTLSLQFSSVNGDGYLKDVYMLVATGLSGAHACCVVYDKPSNLFYLFNDTATQLTALMPGSGGTVNNSQCTLYATGSGNAMTIALKLLFTNALTGAQQIYLDAFDLAGMSSGWQSRGVLLLP